MKRTQHPYAEHCIATLGVVVEGVAYPVLCKNCGIDTPFHRERCCPRGEGAFELQDHIDVTALVWKGTACTSRVPCIHCGHVPEEHAYDGNAWKCLFSSTSYEPVTSYWEWQRVKAVAPAGYVPPALECLDDADDPDSRRCEENIPAAFHLMSDLVASAWGEGPDWMMDAGTNAPYAHNGGTG